MDSKRIDVPAFCVHVVPSFAVGPKRTRPLSRNAGSVRRLDLNLIELRGDDVGGPAVHISARIVAKAGSSEVLVSRTVTDLITGSGIDFDAFGHLDSGVPASGCGGCSRPMTKTKETVSCSEFHKRWGQLAVRLQRERRQRGEDLDADMVRASFEVLTYAIGYVVRIAPGHNCVDQSVASAPDNVIIAEAQRSEIVGVVREGEIPIRKCPSRLSRRTCVLLQHNGDLRGQQRIGSQHLTSSSCVLNRYEVGVGTRGPVSRQAQHPMTESGQYPPLSRCGRPGHIQGIEVGHHVAVRAAVVLDDRCVAGPKTEDEPARITEIEVSDSHSDVVGRRGPDAHDAAEDHHPSGCGQKPFKMRREARLESTRGPQCCVAKFFQLGRDVNRGLLGDAPCTAPPDAYLPEIHRITVPERGSPL